MSLAGAGSGDARVGDAAHKGDRTVFAKTITILLLAALASLLAGCNTVAGAGKDIERGGQVIRDTAKDVQKKL
jgi:predicted small secreted protein